MRPAFTAGDEWCVVMFESPDGVELQVKAP